MHPPNRPFEPTVQVPVNVADPLLSIVNESVTPGVNPPPEAVTVTPLGPLAGLSESSGDVTTKFTNEESNAPSDPVAVI
jgi:hypothetical protein